MFKGKGSRACCKYRCSIPVQKIDIKIKNVISVNYPIEYSEFENYDFYNSDYDVLFWMILKKL